MATDDGDFFSDYLVLKPDEGGTFDLFHILFSHNICKNGRVECPEGKELRRLNRRWLLLVSLISQIIFLHLRKPVSWIGNWIESWMNLLSENGGFLQLLLNLIRGKAVFPNRNSATYKSCVCNLDVRVELDKEIKDGDSRYYAALSVMAAKFAYENEAFIQRTVGDIWKMKFVEFFNCWNDYQGKESTQAFMFSNKEADPELIVLAFRGTEPFDVLDWCSDVDFSWYEIPGMGKIHGGFMKSLGLQKKQGWPKEIEQGGKDRRFAYYAIRERVKDILQKHQRARLLVTGHSLGGALAVIFPAILALHGEMWMLDRIVGIYTFGQPRVGDGKFGEYMKGLFSRHDIRYYRFVYSNDIVPRLPCDDSTLLFKHFGTCLYYNSCYEGKIVADEPNKNYFSIWRVIPKYLNAAWELGRSFTMGCTRGPDYREGWFQKLFRAFGLIIPGLSAHGLQDYVNVTRLGISLIPPIATPSTKLD